MTRQEWNMNTTPNEEFAWEIKEGSRSTVRVDPHLQMVYFEFSQIPDLTSSLRHTTRLSVADIMIDG